MKLTIRPDFAKPYSECIFVNFNPRDKWLTKATARFNGLNSKNDQWNLVIT